MIGIDAIEIERFRYWHKYPETRLEKIFTKREIEYCRANLSKSAERFAVRFAAKEAVYKSLNNYLKNNLSFMKSANQIEVIKTSSGKPEIILSDFLQKNLVQKVNIEISLTHTKTTAIAMVLIS